MILGTRVEVPLDSERSEARPTGRPSLCEDSQGGGCRRRRLRQIKMKNGAQKRRKNSVSGNAEASLTTL